MRLLEVVGDLFWIIAVFARFVSGGPIIALAYP